MSYAYTFTKKLLGQDTEMTAHFEHWVDLENRPNGQVEIDRLTAKVENVYTGEITEVDVSSLLDSTLAEEEVAKLIMDDFVDWHDPTP